MILVGVIPGPHEPKLNINSYLQPLVAELNKLWADGIIVKVHGALLCVGCDVPAARKVCGFMGHASNKGCSVNTKIDFSGFEPCPPRTNFEHPQQAQEAINQTSAGDCFDTEQKNGTRYTELLSLPYFDCVRFHVIDPMHNLFTGTAKHVMKNIWLDSDNPLLEKKNLLHLREKLHKLKVPSDVGRMPRKIQNSYGGFPADQWKSFTCGTMGCSCLCSQVITETKAMLAHSYLLKFCQAFESLYGKDKVTPNIHLHTHLVDCVLDYGPVYAFWLLVLNVTMAYLESLKPTSSLLKYR